MIFLLLLALCVPSLAQATVFWTEDFEPGSVMSNNTFLTGTLIPQGSYALDTNIKHGGTRSLRLNFPSNCQNTISQGQCGGSLSRQYGTAVADTYTRAWLRVSGDTNQGATIGSAGGAFQTYQWAYTKLFEDVANSGTSTPPRTWLVFGGAGVTSRGMSLHAENVPSDGATMKYDAGFSLQDNQWYCIETHKKMNTAGTANGIAQVWVNDVLRVDRSDVLWRNGSGADLTSLWTEFEMFRQGGFGNMWWDDLATGDSRIGCGGTLPTQDTTNPNPPTNLTAQ